MAVAGAGQWRFWTPTLGQGQARWFLERLERRGEDEVLAWHPPRAGGRPNPLRKRNDYVIIDTPPKIDSDLRPALRRADLVVVPVATSQVDLWRPRRPGPGPAGNATR